MEKLIRNGMSPDEAAKVAGVGRTMIFNEIRRGRLPARKCGCRTIITDPDLEAWLDGLPQIEPSAA
jgi:excisionase family DNA binding protein